MQNEKINKSTNSLRKVVVETKLATEENEIQVESIPSDSLEQIA